MKILILGLNFAPEPTGVGKYTSEFAAWLVGQGHEVRVVTAPPYYPGWRVAGSHVAWRYRVEELAGAKVWRCPLWVPRTPSTAKRVGHLVSFALSSFLPCLWQALRWRPDVVWTVEPTLLCAPTALLAARLAGARACLHVQDLELEAASRLCMLSKSWLCRNLRAAYGWLLQRFDLVSTIARRMRTQLAALGVADERLCLFPNWVDTAAITPGDPGGGGLRRALGLGAGQLVALYAGSMGAKQGLDGLVEVADRLAAHPTLHLVLCGEGPTRPRLERQLAGRANVRWLPVQPAARLRELLALADVHLLPQRAEAGSFALPSKLGGILASGRPVVAQADGGELAAAARQCGILVAPGDPAAMAEGILALAADGRRRRALGAAARHYAETRLDARLIFARYERRLLDLARPVATRPRPAVAGALRGMRWLPGALSPPQPTVSPRRR